MTGGGAPFSERHRADCTASFSVQLTRGIGVSQDVDERGSGAASGSVHRRAPRDESFSSGPKSVSPALRSRSAITVRAGPGRGTSRATGAFAVVVSTAITHPTTLTTWFHQVVTTA
ncbi:hypothetical protein FM103_11305 [Corynebacterium xerosis]|nr:hypothetical protein FM103_11305 [Corynebacterium xerosis]